MHDSSAQRFLPVRRRLRVPACLGVFLLVAPPALFVMPSAEAAEGRSGGGRSARVSRPAPPPPAYRTQGRYRGAERTAPRKQPYYQPSLSGIPQSYLQSRPTARAPRVLSEPGVPYVVPSYVYFEPQQQPRERVIVVQQPAPQPPPQQPVVVVVPQPVLQPAGGVPVAPAPEPAAPAAPRLPGTVRFAVEPADAIVYLNDRRIGTGADLKAAAAAEVSAGVHVLEVSHPDHTSERLVFGVDSDAMLEVMVDLAATKPSRRSRLLDQP